MSVLITDANKRTSIYALRSLGKKGIDVTAAEIDSIRKPIGFYSKYCRNSVHTPEYNDFNYIPRLLKLAKSHEVLIPISTDSMIPISKNIHKFQEITKVPIPEYTKLEIANDKELTLRLGEEVGLNIPKSTTVRNVEELENITKDINYPVVIKHRRSSGAQGVGYAYSPHDLISKYKKMSHIQEKPIIQEYIEGQGYGFFALFNENSKPIATFVHKRIREYPITGGQSTFCESVINPKVYRDGMKLLKSLDWYGLAMVEFKQNKEGKPFLMEINPRFWGSMPLAIESGVDFPYLLYKMAVDGNVDRVKSYKVGVKTRFLLSDIFACSQLLLKKNNKMETLKSTILPFFDQNVVEGLLSIDDPSPNIYFLKDRILRTVRR